MVVLAAVLILTLIGLGRRIARQAREIDARLDETREHTEVLFELIQTNRSLQASERGLRRLRGAVG